MKRSSRGILLLAAASMLGACGRAQRQDGVTRVDNQLALAIQ